MVRRLGANIWSIPRRLRDPIKFLRKVAELGYEGAELAVDDSDLRLSLSELRSKWGALREEASSLGLELPSIASGLFWLRNMVVEPEKALEVVRVECEVASVVGASIILVVPGVAVSDIPYEEHFIRVAKALKEASRVAREYGVYVGIEPVWNRLFPSPLDFRRLLEEVGEDNVKLYFDVGNTLPHSLPEHWIRSLKDWLVQVHVKDFSIDELKFTPPGLGSVNWSAVKSALDEVGYNGWLVAELPWGPEEEPYKYLVDTAKFVRESLM